MINLSVFGGKSGILFLSSVVNTELKKLFNVSALSKSVSVKVPSSLIKFETPSLVLILDAMY